MGLEKVEKKVWHLSALGAALPQLVSDIVGNIARPFFVGVECNYPNGIVALTFQQMANERLLIGIIFICLAPSSAKPLAELIEDEKDVLAGVRPHNRWHTRTPLDWTRTPPSPQFGAARPAKGTADR